MKRPRCALSDSNQLKIESNGGSYNSGIANRSNSHARAEDAVKNGLGSMRACALASACPAKDWSSLAQVISVNVSRESGNNFLGLYVDPLLIFGGSESRSDFVLWNLVIQANIAHSMDM